jgi:antitoxin (DNA-binding transcriptional repressor) of toxin-antitoxin stability system
MDRVNVRQLRAGLAAAVRRAGAGDRLVITVGGQPVAQLGPLDPVADPPTLADLAHRGLVTPPRRTDRPPPDVTIDPWIGTRLDRAVADLRGG